MNPNIESFFPQIKEGDVGTDALESVIETLWADIMVLRKEAGTIIDIIGIDPDKKMTRIEQMQFIARLPKMVKRFIPNEDEEDNPEFNRVNFRKLVELVMKYKDAKI